jgi:hypothetical protein
LAGTTVKETEMQKMTFAEKKARGTLHKCRVAAPRTLETVRQEIEETEQALTDMRHVLALALAQIRKRGLMVTTKVLDSNGKGVRTEKLNPALKVQKDALSSVRSLKRYLVLLREEENLASEKQKDNDDFSDFD